MAEQARDISAQIIAKLQAEIKALKGGQGNVRKSKDGRKVSVYGIGQFPATYFKGQWETILANAEAIKALVATLPEKGESE